MTDTTDQQAVTVAQEDREAAAGYLDSQGGYVIDAAVIRTGQADFKDIVHAFARHRLASVPSASADYVLVPREPTEAMLEALHRDVRIKADPALKTADIMNEREVWSAMLAASPEPAPATNQAGEVERAILDAWLTDVQRAAIKGAIHVSGDWVLTTEYEDDLEIIEDLPESIADPVSGILTSLGNLIRAALATQPATSQEGEGNEARRVLTRITVAHNRLRRSEITSQEFDTYALGLLAFLAATPTPPTEAREGELREALAWYGEQARLARLIHSEGDAGRNALAADGGKRAFRTLSAGSAGQ